jgi:hypothetical protein
MGLREWTNRRLARHVIVLRTAFGIIVQTGIFAVGGLAFWAVVGHNAGGTVLGETATASSIASLGSAMAAAGAMHLVIARKAHLRPLVSSLGIVAPVVAFAVGAIGSDHARLLVGLWAAGAALGLVADAAAVASQRPRRVVFRAGVQVAGTLGSAFFLHSFTEFVATQAFFTGVAAIIQFAYWATRPDFSLLRRLSKDVWSNHIAAVTGLAPVYVVAPLATIMANSVVAGRAYLAMALVGPLTSISVALSAGVHTGGHRDASDTQHLYGRSLLTVLSLATLASCATVLLHYAEPSFGAVAHVTAAITFATVLDASANIFSALWRLQRRLVVVPLLYCVELVAFTLAVALTIHPLGLTSVVCGWYAQGVAGVIVVFLVERRLTPAPASTPSATSAISGGSVA